jgi:hypothetical protein
VKFDVSHTDTTLKTTLKGTLTPALSLRERKFFSKRFV